ncbi:RNA polymerase sigma-70 factor (ECF subfamily) [Curtobacterium sp. PhB42]|uniref:RNA polymerase sigma factor n=1 Tax=unclassified Curtobacterium TaxID=257496 RepID=UPI0010DDD0EC|nr:MULTISPECIES: sigma-70 family RNA polymerase sigma factor [unclassified Curtobacterium]TDW39689.1 RNA polymerase sigma-70 factor (ECF subfamily) [Curtobacterium sp. PhB42]TDW50796.1 RNA polymerase sigma-70 factor (ECF subfamily) [Curtobacterium sp. PhB190]
MSTDSDIIRQAVDVPAVFAQLYDRHARPIHRYAARRAGPDVADDLLSETFTVAFERRGDYDFGRPDALPWLYGIVSTLLKRHRRVEARAWLSVRPDPTALVTEHHHEALEAVLEVRQLGTALRRMPARDRDALLLYAWGDLDYEGVAQALDVPVGTVRSRLNRARRMLRAAAGRTPAEEVDHGRADTTPIRP